MIKGMTGYGSASLSLKDLKGTVEIKSLNGRYLDVSYYLPIGYNSFEDKIRRLCQKVFQRGRVTVSFKITHKRKDDVVLNTDAVESYLKHARSMKRKFKIKNDLNISDIIKLPGVLNTKETSIASEKVWPPFEKSLKTAMNSLDRMRKREGSCLQKDIKDKLRLMSKQIQTVQQRSRIILSDKRKKLTSEEYQSFQRGCDVNEELSRLKHYVSEMKRLFGKNASVGKRIDFVAQEMQRETNTIGSKLQDRIVSNAVITLKSKIEKIREQAQNIE